MLLLFHDKSDLTTLTRLINELNSFIIQTPVYSWPHKWPTSGCSHGNKLSIASHATSVQHLYSRWFLICELIYGFTAFRQWFMILAVIWLIWWLVSLQHIHSNPIVHSFVTRLVIICCKVSIKTHDSELRGQGEAAIIHETKITQPLRELFTRKTAKKIANALAKLP